jgi:hypothetical protein
MRRDHACARAGASGRTIARCMVPFNERATQWQGLESRPRGPPKPESVDTRRRSEGVHLPGVRSMPSGGAECRSFRESALLGGKGNSPHGSVSGPSGGSRPAPPRIADRQVHFGLGCTSMQSVDSRVARSQAIVQRENFGSRSGRNRRMRAPAVLPWMICRPRGIGGGVGPGTPAATIERASGSPPTTWGACTCA